MSFTLENYENWTDGVELPSPFIWHMKDNKDLQKFREDILHGVVDFEKQLNKMVEIIRDCKKEIMK